MPKYFILKKALFLYYTRNCFTITAKFYINISGLTARSICVLFTVQNTYLIPVPFFLNSDKP